jgi:hypothetical protein
MTPEHYPLKEKVIRFVICKYLAAFFRDLSQSEKLSEIKLPLALPIIDFTDEELDFHTHMKTFYVEIVWPVINLLSRHEN